MTIVRGLIYNYRSAALSVEQTFSLDRNDGWTPTTVPTTVDRWQFQIIVNTVT